MVIAMRATTLGAGGNERASFLSWATIIRASRAGISGAGLAMAATGVGNILVHGTNQRWLLNYLNNEIDDVALISGIIAVVTYLLVRLLRLATHDHADD